MTNHIREQGRWLVRAMAKETGKSEAEVEASLNELLERGHLRVLYGSGPHGRDEFQPLIHGEDTTGVRIGEKGWE